MASRPAQSSWPTNLRPQHNSRSTDSFLVYETVDKPAQVRHFFLVCVFLRQTVIRQSAQSVESQQTVRGQSEDIQRTFSGHSADIQQTFNRQSSNRHSDSQQTGVIRQSSDWNICQSCLFLFSQSCWSPLAITLIWNKLKTKVKKEHIMF